LPPLDRALAEKALDEARIEAGVMAAAEEKMVAARDEGIREGEEKGKLVGREEGVREEKIETAKKMLRKKTSLEMIEDITGLSVDEIKRLKNSL
jgi:predicted transposase/invertase (TIGR01784 family)